MNKTKTPEEKMIDIVEKALFTHEPLTKEEARFFYEYDIKSRGEKNEHKRNC